MPKTATPTSSARATSKPRIAKRDLDHLRRCKKDLEFYARTHLKILPKRPPVISPFTFNFSQRFSHKRMAAQAKAEGRVRIIILKARQQGMSTLVAGRFFRAMHLLENISTVVVADKLKKAHNLFQIYDRFHEHLIPAVSIERTAYDRDGFY